MMISLQDSRAFGPRIPISSEIDIWFLVPSLAAVALLTICLMRQRTRRAPYFSGGFVLSLVPLLMTPFYIYFYSLFEIYHRHPNDFDLERLFHGIEARFLLGLVTTSLALISYTAVHILSVRSDRSRISARS